MAIPLEILIPSALAAVLFLICFVRLLNGPKNATLTIESCMTHLQAEDPEFSDYTLSFDANNKYALATDKTGKHRYLIRSFGDRLVVQNLSENDITATENTVTVKRQDIAHSAVHFTLQAGDANE